MAREPLLDMLSERREGLDGGNLKITTGVLWCPTESPEIAAFLLVQKKYIGTSSSLDLPPLPACPQEPGLIAIRLVLKEHTCSEAHGSSG